MPKKIQLNPKNCYFPPLTMAEPSVSPPPMPTQAIGKFSTPTHANNKLTFSVDCCIARTVIEQGGGGGYCSNTARAPYLRADSNRNNTGC